MESAYFGLISVSEDGRTEDYRALNRSQCSFCRHKFDGSGACTAFPEGIPTEILLNRLIHTAPATGDGNVLFEAKEGVPADLTFLPM